MAKKKYRSLIDLYKIAWERVEKTSVNPSKSKYEKMVEENTKKAMDKAYKPAGVEKTNGFKRTK